jgi:hypothetical protein
MGRAVGNAYKQDALVISKRNYKGINIHYLSKVLPRYRSQWPDWYSGNLKEKFNPELFAF